MEYRCNHCNKVYSSYQSLWIHNKKFHNNNIIHHQNNSNYVLNNSTNVLNNSNCIPLSYKCKYCNKSYEKVKTR